MLSTLDDEDCELLEAMRQEFGQPPASALRNAAVGDFETAAHSSLATRGAQSKSAESGSLTSVRRTMSSAKQSVSATNAALSNACKPEPTQSSTGNHPMCECLCAVEEKCSESEEHSDDCADAKGVSAKKASIEGIGVNGVIESKSLEDCKSYAPVLNIDNLSGSLNLTFGNRFESQAFVAGQNETRMTLTSAAASGSLQMPCVQAKAGKYQSVDQMQARLQVVDDSFAKCLLFMADMTTRKFDSTTDISPLEYLETLCGLEFTRIEKKVINMSGFRAKRKPITKIRDRRSIIKEMFANAEKEMKKKRKKEKKRKKKQRKRERKKVKEMAKEMEKKTKGRKATSCSTHAKAKATNGALPRRRNRKRSQRKAVETDAFGAMSLLSAGESEVAPQKPVRKRLKTSTALRGM